MSLSATRRSLAYGSLSNCDTSVYVWDLKTKKWHLFVKSGCLCLCENIIACSQNDDDTKKWRLVGGALKQKGERTLILGAFDEEKKFEKLAIRFSTVANSKSFAKKYRIQFSLPEPPKQSKKRQKHRRIRTSENDQKDDDESGHKRKLPKFNPTPTIISHPDVFICGYYRKLLLFGENRDEFNIIPSDICLAIFRYAHKKPSSVPIDEVCARTYGNGWSVFEENGVVWSATLNRINIANNANKLYVAQILKHDDADRYVLFFRWARVGYDGQNSQKEQSKSKCIADFKKKFKDKTGGNNWDTRDSDFQPKKGKYIYLPMD